MDGDRSTSSSCSRESTLDVVARRRGINFCQLSPGAPAMKSSPHCMRRDLGGGIILLERENILDGCTDDLGVREERGGSYLLT